LGSFLGAWKLRFAELKKEIAALTATVKKQAAQIQKVSADLDLSRTAPQIVLNNQ
jgi:hypothetical protein